jgi:hypothetical protein
MVMVVVVMMMMIFTLPVSFYVAYELGGRYQRLGETYSLRLEL